MDQYKRLTIPSRAKEPQNGHNSKIHRNSQLTVEDQITLDLPAIPYENPWTQQTDALNVLLPVTIPFTPRPVHHNGSAHRGSTAIAFQPVGIPFAPDSQINRVTRRTEHTTWESPTVSTSHSKGKATSKWRFLFELPHLLVYMVGALAIFGLYLLIPLLILLNATFRGSLNTLIVALGIMASGELLVCFILARTIPRGKMKKRRAFAKS